MRRLFSLFLIVLLLSLSFAILWIPNQVKSPGKTVQKFVEVYYGSVPYIEEIRVVRENKIKILLDGFSDLVLNYSNKKSDIEAYLKSFKQQNISDKEYPYLIDMEYINITKNEKYVLEIKKYIDLNKVTARTDYFTKAIIVIDKNLLTKSIKSTKVLDFFQKPRVYFLKWTFRGFRIDWDMTFNN